MTSREDLDHVLAKSGPALDTLKGARIFLTGGTGFFGKWLVETFVHANRERALEAELTVLSRDPEAFLHSMPHLKGAPGLAFARGDVRSFELPQGTFTHIIHAATPASAKLNAEAPREMLDTIIRGTERVLEIAAQSKKPRLLLTSSGAVYGKQPSELTHVPETYLGAPDPLEPSSAYGEGKRVSEHLCVLAGRAGVCVPLIARCWAFSGPHLPLDAHFAIGNFIRDARAGGPIRIGGDGTPYRSYLYAADLAAWLWTLLARGEPVRAYNVGSDQALTIKELAETVARHYGCGVEIAGKPTPGKPADRYVPSTDRARAELGLEAWIGLEDGLRRTEEFLARTAGAKQ